MSNAKPIPGFSRYGVTEDARIFNLETGKELRTSADVRGYHATILVDDHGERKGIRRHRVVALTHLPKPPDDLRNYVVNHIDEIPGNDWKDNLEWCTQATNVNQWYENGGKKTTVPLDVLDVETNEVVSYPSIGACSKTLGINRYSIHGRLNRGPEYIWPEGKRYRLGNSDEPWPDVKAKANGRARLVLMKDLRTNSVVVFEKLTEVLPFIGYKLPTVWMWANDHRQPVVPGLYQLQFSNSAVPWREVEDVFEELQEGMNCKVVLRFDSDWGNPIWYESATICSKLNDLKPTALNYRLKYRGQKVFNDGKRYCYYSDLSNVHKETIRYEIPPEGRVQRPSKATPEVSVSGE